MEKRQNQIVFFEVPEVSDYIYQIVLAHKSRSDEEEVFKRRVKEAVDFAETGTIWVPNIEPSIKLKLNGEKTLTFREGKKPAICYNFQWFKKAASNISKSCKTRIGTKDEMIRYLAYTIVKLMQDNPNYEEREIWNMICNDSSAIGNYSSNMKLTGSYKILGHADFGNNFKLVNPNLRDTITGTHYVFGGSCRTMGNIVPVANAYEEPDSMVNLDMTPWVICEKNPDGILGKVVK